jgi:K(+)-stimulated pyrophosphate-energized sodium pump
MATDVVSLNPIIKFSTLFGLLAVEIAVSIRQAAVEGNRTNYGPYVGVVFLAVALVFVWRSFYAMRIPKDEALARTPTHGGGDGHVAAGAPAATH